MHVIFDLDGTLFQTAICEYYAMNQLRSEYSLPSLSEQIIKQNIGKQTADFLKCYFPESYLSDTFIEHYHNLEHAAILQHGSLFPDIPALLEHLKRNHCQLDICSNGSVEYINRVLDKTNIRAYFRHLITAQNFSSKADAIRTLLTEESPAVIVGDTTSDFDAANKNFLPSIGAAYGYGNDLSAATYRAETPLEIMDLVMQCDLFYQITKKLFSCTIQTIGINGIDTSGKTVFSNHYSRFLSSRGIENTVLHMDDFHNPAAIRRHGKNEIDAYYRHAFNYETLVQQILLPLKREGILNKKLLCLNLDTDIYENPLQYTVTQKGILIIEGVLLFRPPLIRYLDKKIYLHISFEEMLKRAAERDVPKYGTAILEKYQNKYIPIQKRYFEEFHPAQNADIVINNENFRRPVILS